MTWRSRLWARILLRPDASNIQCAKTEVIVPHGAGATQLWVEHSRPDHADVEPELVVLRLLGARGRAERSTQDPANRLSGVRSATWTLNPPGFGQSGGPLAIDHYLQGAVAVYDHIVARHPTSRMWVYGKSIGATAALHLAANRQPELVVLKNPINIPRIVERRLSKWLPNSLARRLAAKVTFEVPVMFWARHARCSALFVISNDDSVAPIATQIELIENYGGPRDVFHVEGEHDTPSLHDDDEIRYRKILCALWRNE